MEASEIVLSIIIGLIGILLITYSFFASKEKGPILSNAYLLASEEERRKLDKPAEYRLISIIFGVLGLVFILEALYILTSWIILLYIMGTLIAFDIFYAFRVTWRSEKKNI